MKLSIIVPVYNVERYLRPAMDSILSQTYADWEAICVDDGSTDGSGRILDEYSLRDKRIKVVHQANAQVYAARNHALSLATGEWVGFFDPDDLIAPQWFEIAMSVTDGVDMVRMECTRDIQQLKNCSRKNLEYIDSALDWGWETFSRSGFLWLCFIKRSLIGDLRFRGGINCKEDGIFLLELLRNIKHVVQVDYPGYFYRVVAGSLSTKKKTHVEQVVSYLEALGEVYSRAEPEICKLGLQESVRRIVNRNAVADICSWALKIDGSEHRDYDKVYDAWDRMRSTVGCGQTRTRYKWVFALWEKTGWVKPLSFTCKLFAIGGGILREIGLRK